MSDQETVARRWSQLSASSDVFSSSVYWLAVPAVRARHQRRACAGRPYASWVEYCLREFLRDLPVRKMLSIGCGHGSLERHLHSLNAFERCDAFDIAPGAIENARQSAREVRASTISYCCVDVENVDLERKCYDAVWFNMSLHHISALELVLQRVRDSLAEAGLLFLNEYVGPNRFGFPAAQQEAIAHAFHLIPPRYRKSFAPETFGQTLAVPPNPDPVEVARADPSESARSQDILPVLSRYFEIVALNKCGGTLLQFLLSGIAGNFHEDDPSSMKVLEMLFTIEDALIDSGTLDSDFVVVAARPRSVVDPSHE